LTFYKLKAIALEFNVIVDRMRIVYNSNKLIILDVLSELYAFIKFEEDPSVNAVPISNYCSNFNSLIFSNKRQLFEVLAKFKLPLITPNFLNVILLLLSLEGLVYLKSEAPDEIETSLLKIN